MKVARTVGWILLTSLWITATLARAHTAHAQPPHRGSVTAEQRQAAAEAYDRGSAAYLARNFAEAARWFETADQLAPTPSSLIQAIRAHQRADDVQRAATLALRLEAWYPDNPQARRTARSILRRHQAQLFRVDVRCEACDVQLDDALAQHPSFFLEPGSEHRVVASFETGERAETVRGDAGETRELHFEAPPPPPPPPDPVPAPVAGSDPPPVEAPPENDGWTPWVFWSGVGLTAAATGVTIWSGLDTLDGVDPYESDPTQEALDEGQRKELRTNVLLGVSVGLGVGTALVGALLTDWGSGGELEAGLAPGPDGGTAWLGGRF